MAQFQKGFYCTFNSKVFGDKVTIAVNTNKKEHYHDILDKNEDRWGFYVNKRRPADNKRIKFLVSADFNDAGDTTDNLQIDVYDGEKEVSLCLEQITDNIVVSNIR